eukprot:3762408-Prymnesium_polylepis.1
MGWRARRPERQADGREAPAGEHVLKKWERRRRGAGRCREGERAGQVGTLGCAHIEHVPYPVGPSVRGKGADGEWP